MLGIRSAPSGGKRLAFQAPPSIRPACSPSTSSTFSFYEDKKWQKRKQIKLTKNGKPLLLPMHVKKGDKVVVIAGNDKGKVGKVKKVFETTQKIRVGGVNVRVRRMEGPDGDKTERYNGLLAASNVMHWSDKEQVRSRVGKKIVDGRKVRYLIKTGEVLDS
jgi:large subunit ribosomal protein L24